MSSVVPATGPARRTTSPTRLLVELLPPFVVALLLLPFVISYGRFWPWVPSTIDLQVYVYAVKDMLAGRDIFATTTPFWNLYFIYPPIAAVLGIPRVGWSRSPSTGFTTLLKLVTAADAMGIPR